jgi:hypothetical protein
LAATAGDTAAEAAEAAASAADAAAALATFAGAASVFFVIAAFLFDSITYYQQIQTRNSLPGQLDAVLANAEATTPNIDAMAQDTQGGQAALFGDFVGATLPGSGQQSQVAPTSNEYPSTFVIQNQSGETNANSFTYQDAGGNTVVVSTDGNWFEEQYLDSSGAVGLTQYSLDLNILDPATGDLITYENVDGSLVAMDGNGQPDPVEAISYTDPSGGADTALIAANLPAGNPLYQGDVTGVSTDVSTSLSYVGQPITVTAQEIGAAPSDPPAASAAFNIDVAGNDPQNEGFGNCTTAQLVTPPGAPSGTRKVWTATCDAARAGAYIIQVGVVEPGGGNGQVGGFNSQEVVVNFEPLAVGAFTSPSTTQPFTEGQPGSFTVTTSSAPYPYLTATGLPPGLTFTDNYDGTATIAGTPAAGTAGLYTVDLSGSNVLGTMSPQQLTLAVDSVPSFTSPNAVTFTQGTTSSFTVSTSGYPTASLSADLLPPGMTFTDNGDGTGTLSGTPTTTGQYAVWIGAVNTASFTSNLSGGLISTPAIGGQYLEVTVGQAPAITSSPGYSFLAGQAGSFTFTSTGTPTPSYTESGALPAGVSFTDNGDGTATLSGTPTTAGSFPITVTAGNGVGSAATQSFALSVDQTTAFTGAAGATFTAGRSGSFTVTTSGYPAPDVSVVGSTLPSWLTLTNNGDGTATLAGTPPVGGPSSYSFTLQAYNGVDYERARIGGCQGRLFGLSSQR